MQPTIIRLVLLVVIVACGAGLYEVVDSAQTLPLRQAQDSALQRFGPDLLNLCQTAVKNRTASLPDNVKVAVIDSDKKTVYDVYQDSLPASVQASDKSDVAVLLCLSESKNVYATDKYGQSETYTCTRYSRDLTGYLIDVKTGKTFNFSSFDGVVPPECPDSTSSDISRTGDIPLASDIADWVASVTKSN